MKLSLLALVLLLSSLSEAAWKVRAREHFYENHKVKYSDGQSTEYRGLSNTINIWYEEPFKYSLGLSISPVLGQSKPVDGAVAEFGTSFQLKVYGIEGKYFPITSQKFFLRGGFGHTELSSQGSIKSVTGTSYYLGLGWEIPFMAVHLAPEFAYRSSSLSETITVESSIFSLGVHFYKHF